MKLTQRREPDNGVCTLSKLTLGFETLDTIERPWIPDLIGRGGRKGISCVPKGLYRLVPHDTEAHPKTWALVNPELDVYHQPDDVPVAKRQYARTAVLIHAANYAHELRGCIAPGLRRGVNVVWDSRRAMHRIQTGLPWEEHSLEII